MNLLKKILSYFIFRRPTEIKLGSIWWDEGLISEGSTCQVYIVLGKDSDDYWTCAGLSFWGGRRTSG